MNRFTPLVFSLVFLVIAVAAYAFLSYETARALSSAASVHAQAASADAEGLYQQSISSFLSATASDRAALDAFVPADEDVPVVIQDVEDAAAREKVVATIGAVSVAPSDWQYHEPLEIKLSARGSFAALAAFATDLESLPQASHLSSFSAQSSGNGSWFASYTVDFVKEKTPPTP
jgi:Tfp pilus assembly protein PilO